MNAVRRPVTVNQIGSRLLLSALVALWAQGWLPNLVSLFTSGRGYISGLASTAERSGFASTLANLLVLTALAAAIAALFLGLADALTARPAAYLLLLGLWLLLYPWHGLGGVNTATIIFPAMIVAWLLLRPPATSVYRLLALLGLLTAVGSILFGLVSSLAFMPAQWTADADKALIGDRILAGPYSHSNALGLSLALTLPFVITEFRGRGRLFATLAMVVAMIWSASRLSIATSAATLLLALVTVYASEIAARRLLSVTVTLAAVLVVTLPLAATDATFLTNRGHVWIAALGHAQRRLADGHGWDVFREVNTLTSSMGYVSTTGHNVFVTMFTAGGILGVALVATIVVTAFANGRATFPVDRVRLLFLAVLLIVSIAEDPSRALATGPNAFVIYPMLIVMLDTSQRPKRLGGVEARTSVVRRRRVLVDASASSLRSGHVAR